jgi:hypothetical protein
MADISTDALVLSDAEGNYYVVPRDVIEQTRVAPSSNEAIDAELGIETEGFSALHVGLGFSLIGPLKLNQQQSLGDKLPQVGWPYYRPGLGLDTGDPAAPQH